MSSSWTDKYLFRKWHLTRFNCWTLVCDVYQEKLGITLPQYVEINALNDAKVSAMMESESNANWELSNGGLYNVAALGVGDTIHHVAVVIAPGKVLHVNKGTMGRIESFAQLAESFRTIKFYSYALHRHH